MSRAPTGNINSFNNVLNNFTFTAVDDEPKILAWLSPLEPDVRHRDIRNQRVGSVGDWILGTEEFRSWYKGSGKDELNRAVLFCYGDPGVGKSFINSVVVDYLGEQTMGQDVAVACLYYDFASREEQSPTNMLGAALKHLFAGLDSIPVEIRQKFRDQKRVVGGQEPQLSDIVNMFPTVSSLQHTFICVDAIDECVPTHRLEVLDALRKILQRSPNTRIFITGRPHIRGVVERELGGRATSVSIKPRDDDIVTYLRARLRKDTTPEAMDSGLENDIVQRIPAEISESFLLVSLKVEAILSETTIYRRRKRLNAMGDGLGLSGAYEATLERIRAQDREKTKLGMATLMWICHSERPLQVDELRHALAVEVGSRDFYRDNIPATETVLACCQGLVIVDKEASTARLIHHTLREYLLADPNLFGRAHSAMAETCLTYLNSDQVKALSTKPQVELSSMPFLKYCSRYWGTHANRELSDHTRLLAMELLGQHGNDLAAKLLLEQILESDDSLEVNAPSQLSGLQCASFFGIAGFMAALLEGHGCDINQGDSAGVTPLIWAVRSGNMEAVKLLLAQETISPNKPDNRYHTPLIWAAMKGHESMVKRLLGRKDVNPNQPEHNGISPLSYAAFGGHEAVVKQLLDRKDVNPNQPDHNGISPLSCAAFNGHESVVRQLLDRKDINPNTADKEGKTPLTSAAYSGHGSVVKKLLDRKDVNPDTVDKRGRTPLTSAVFNGHESVVKQLLDRKDVNPDTVDEEGRSPLTWAAVRGHEPVVKQLLDRKDVNPNQPDHNGISPLSCAAFNGHESVVRQLLDRKDINPNTADKEGKTPLAYATFNGHEAVVKHLLGRKDLNPDEPDNEGNTPLSWAAIKGHECVVKQLLDRKDVNPDKPDNGGNTPLSWAAIKGHERVVKQLVDRKDVDPNTIDKEGRTPLTWAANNGHESVVKKLLDRGDASPSMPVRNGGTGTGTRVDSLEPHLQGGEGRTPLSRTTIKGRAR